MGAVNTTYTFTATDTITSTKMNNIIDETVMTSDAVLGGSGGSGGLDISSGKLSISANAINSSRLAANSVTSTNIVDGTIVNADISPTAAIAGTKISPNFGDQTITTTGGDLSLSNTGTCYVQTNSGTVQGLFYSSSTNPVVAVGSSSNNPLLFFTNNDEQMRITATGIVGIGTTAPQSGLHISGLGQTTPNIIDNGNEYAFLRVSDSNTDTGSGGGIIFASSQSDDNGAVGMAAIKGFLRDGGDNTIGDLTFSTRNAKTDTALTERMRIEYSGNVGIGTTDPTTKLDVNGTVTATAFAGGTVTGTTITGTTITGTSFVGAIPSGAIMPFARNSVPSGWLAANGAAVSRTTYDDLFAAIGTTYGAGNGSTTFNLPDLRGYFVRGSGTNTDGTASGTFGTKQDDMVGPHNHPNSVFQGELALGSGGWRYDSFEDGNDKEFKTNYSTNNNTGTETRPANIAMLYCIKI